MSAEQIISQYSTEYEKFSATLPGQSIAWLKTLRQDASRQFSAHGFPSVKEEEWRYTNVSAIENKLFLPLASAKISPIEINKLHQYLLPDAWSIVLLDGHFSATLSRLKGIPESVSIMSIATALEEQTDLLAQYFSKAVEAKEHGFIAFNTAWFNDGLLIHIPAKEVLTKPIQILHVATQANFMANTRNIIALQESAEAKIVETFIGCDQVYCCVAVMEIFLAQNADLILYKLQMEGEEAYHFGGTYIKQAQGSHFEHQNFSFGGLLARNDIHTDLEQATECTLNGLYLGIKCQHIDHHTRINHLQPDAVSHQLYKGVLNQRAKGIFQGRIVVAEQAQKTDSMMNNHNLLLSDDAEADTKPQLEIYADDVKCAHGVTVGQLESPAIFYLQSRCIDEQTAKNMLTFAFANEMVEKIKLPELHDKVLEQLLVRFPQTGMQQEEYHQAKIDQ